MLVALFYIPYLYWVHCCSVLKQSPEELERLTIDEQLGDLDRSSYILKWADLFESNQFYLVMLFLTLSQRVNVTGFQSLLDTPKLSVMLVSYIWFGHSWTSILALVMLLSYWSLVAGNWFVDSIFSAVYRLSIIGVCTSMSQYYWIVGIMSWGRWSSSAGKAMHLKQSTDLPHGHWNGSYSVIQPHTASYNVIQRQWSNKQHHQWHHQLPLTIINPRNATSQSTWKLSLLTDPARLPQRIHTIVGLVFSWF